MKIDGQAFLEELARLPSDTFESHFSKVAGELGLGNLWERNELKLLYEAAWCACLSPLMVRTQAMEKFGPNTKDNGGSSNRNLWLHEIYSEPPPDGKTYPTLNEKS